MKQRSGFAPFRRLFAFLLVCLLPFAIAAGLSGGTAVRFRDTQAAHAENPANAMESRFDLAYNAAHALSLAALRAVDTT